MPLLLLTGFAIALFTARLESAWPRVFDDSFISFRYAANLADGHGLSWNPGEAPVEGFTNLLFVILVALPIHLALDPLLAARILNLAAIGLVVLLLWRAYVPEGTRRGGLSALVPALILLMLPATPKIAALGLETHLFVLAVTAGALAYARAVRSPSTWRMAQFMSAFVLACLLRPDGSILFAVLMLHGLHAGFAGHRRRFLVVGALMAVLPALIIAAFKVGYFGSLLPESFYVKQSNEGLISSRGLACVTGFIRDHAAILVLAAMGGLLGKRKDGGGASRALLLMALAFGLFYLRVNALMNAFNRFLYPLIPVLLIAARPALAPALDRLGRATRGHVALGFCVVLLAVAAAEPDLKEIRRDLAVLEAGRPKPDYSSRLMHREQRLGRDLAGIPGIRERTIALHDAGVIPYYSRSVVIDLVGLNDRAIARERDLARLRDYVYGRAPDLMIVPVSGSPPDDLQPFENGHGVLGRKMVEFLSDPRWVEYRYAGTVATDSYDLALFVCSRKDPEGRFAADLLGLVDRFDETPLGPDFSTNGR